MIRGTPGDERPMTDAHPSTRDAAARAREFLDRGEPLLAYNVAHEALAEAPGEVTLRRLEALALARSGDIARAHAGLQALAAEGQRDAETMGMLARTHKDLAQATSDAAQRVRHLEASYTLYYDAFQSAQREARHADAFYTGINAAALAVLRGDLPRSRELAEAVRLACDAPAPPGESRATQYWRHATRGEAALILGDGAGAARHYAEGRRVAGGFHGDVATTRRQARLLASQLQVDADESLAALALPPVAVYTGHMVDTPGRPAARFPSERVAEQAQRWSYVLRARSPLAVYGSAACGADLLCLEAARALGIETHVVLPFPPDIFRGASVDFAGAEWGARLDAALAAAASVTVTSDHRASGSDAPFEYANLVLTGMARLRARMLDADTLGIAAWEPASAPVPGGSAALVAQWRRLGIEIVSIPLGPSEVSPALPPRARLPGFRHEMRALLFADAVGYSKMSEDQIPRYVERFLGAIAALNARTHHRHQHVEVAGDGLYMVFECEHDAAAYALELSALARTFDREGAGLPASLDLRIALHCGPVHCGTDPITSGPIYTGPHTSRAARIEPITPPGQVYASSAFAAVAAAHGHDDLSMRYVGRIPLAKGYGTLGLYHLAPPAAPVPASAGSA